ncbi:hypothetical protein DTO013E5_7247 [Penicillium roqueforti]|uniref:Serine aminopeptidase S33 domain-containing protein n=1 Tax=Penicillium roqueforti (strain FM164) TaxID=1365484 RepID=W6QUU8_PENRF|nr:uncharacterized protein LCP9604111_5379 [Penicillium roqueforti]CDM37904.1 unnamed protein product [Penicillium roqueforti FM164]KAF9248629.1 hypothetical protein LCP9604111_5379 [Penicillium roqueforti]KAI2670984.1 hypothetical protein LCP963914a_9743 [Penicillium roqueforti]KAI2671015.1 hypothetical protein CBS147355_8872 [Penicillium roqueforti]KAI2714233.1 hypothetical protein CBS147318_6974 [Penicillium roqueforti]
MTTEESVHILPDGLELYTKTWKTSGSPLAVLAFIHGFSDHCNAYHDLFPTLASAGIEVRSFDQRGWGRSVKESRDRGKTGPTPQVLSDMHSFLQNLPANPDMPLFLMGHSMGGGQVLNYIFHPESPYNGDKSKRPNFTGVLLYSPLIAIDPSSRPSKLTVSAGRLVAKLIPHKQRYSPLDPNLMSRNKAVVDEFVADTLCHDTGTFEGLAGMLDRGIWLEGMFAAGDGAWVKTGLPFWFGHGNGDRVTSHPATENFVKGLTEKGGDVKLRSYEGAYHKLHAELPETTESFLEDVKAWILGKVPGTEGVVIQTEVEAAKGVEGEGGIDTAVSKDADIEGKAKL